MNRSAPPAATSGRHLARPRLVERIKGSRSAAIIAPSGFGKSVVAEEIARHLGHATVYVELSERSGRDGHLFVAQLRRALRGSGLRALADAVATIDDATGGTAAVGMICTLLAERDDPIVIVIDESQHGSGSGAEALAVLVDRAPPGHRLMLVGQALPGWAAAPHIEQKLTAPDLAFRADEILGLSQLAGRPLDEVDVAAVLDATEGWPAAVALAVESGFTDPRTLRQGIARLVDRVLASADPQTRRAVTALAGVPLLSETVSEAVAGPGSLRRLVEFGIPVRARPDGWLVLPDPIRAALARDAEDGGRPLAAETLAAAATAYFDAGAGQTAVTMLLARGAFDEAAATIEARSWQELKEFDPVELRTWLSLLPPEAIAAHPQLLVRMARAANAAGELQWRSALLDRAAESAATQRDPVIAREIDADRAAVAAQHGDVTRTEQLAAAVLDGATSAESATRARALAALGRVRAFERAPNSMSQARQLLADAAALAAMAAEAELLAGIQQALGYNVYFAEGDLSAAERSLRAAAEAAPPLSRERAAILTFLADVLVYSGDLDGADASLREVAEVGRRLRDQGLLGYHAWMKSSIASRRTDAVALATWLDATERHAGDWFNHPTGIEFLAEAVDMLGRVGDHERAAAYLERVEERCAADPHEGVDQIALQARAIHLARAGDARQAETELAALLQSEQLAPRDAWRIHLLRGVAALRAGSPREAAEHASRAFEEAAALGHPELPGIHEPGAMAQLLPLARGLRSAAAESVAQAEPVVAVRVLGDFAVNIGGRAAEPPPGRPATLVKLLAVAGRPVAVDEALEILWPEVDGDTGRARLRNVLARIRSACGDLVRRDGNALTLSEGTVVDATEFMREARSALAAGDERAAAARRAASRYSGELLPGDRYEEFTVVPREQMALLHLGLLDRLALEADKAGDVDEALRVYSEAIAAAPLEEHRYEAAAALAMEHGRRQRAREIVEQALRMLADLDVEPSATLAAVVSRTEDQ